MCGDDDVTDLRVDTALLQEAGAQLRVVAREFGNANATSEYIAEAVGHPDLAQSVRDFADKWDDTRQGMLSNIANLARSATGTGDAFDQLEDAFTAALTGQGS